MKNLFNNSRFNFALVGIMALMLSSNVGILIADDFNPFTRMQAENREVDDRIDNSEIINIVETPISLIAIVSSTTHWFYEVELEWTTTSDAEGTIIERKPYSDLGLWEVVAIVGPGEDRFIDPILLDEDAFVYRVKLFGAGLFSDYSNEVITKFPRPENLDR